MERRRQFGVYCLPHMFLATKSVGVRRLSLLFGFVGAVTGASFVTVEHVTPDLKAFETEIVAQNIVNMLLYPAIGFFAAWALVRTVAWIVAGFKQDGRGGNQG